MTFERPFSVVLLGALSCACSSVRSVPAEWLTQGYTHGYHEGPEVLFGPTGTRRFAGPLLEAFDRQAAMHTLGFADRWYREPANDGFEATLDHLIEELTRAGFDQQPGFELSVLERPMSAPSWTPLRASLTLRQGDGSQRVLHRFEATDDRDRTMLPVHAPEAKVEGEIALDLEGLARGQILVTDRPLTGVLEAASQRGAVAVLSSHLESFNEDPTGEGRHLDAIPYGSVPVGTEMPVAHISPRTHAFLAEHGADGRLAFECEVRLAPRPLRTVIATVVGAEREHEVVALVAHVQEPGANDNASGLAGLLEDALTLKRAIESDAVVRPRRSIAFVWGDEYRASEIFLDSTARSPLAGIAVDMIGESKARTGAICLLERGPDPGALTPLPPDRHTPWGAGQVDPTHLHPNGLAVILRCALVDVGLEAEGWETREHPWEGGSDHDVFIARGIPSALVWHFTDFAYHTSLDRVELVDPRELQLTAVALLTAACGVADAQPQDMKRYADSNLRERYERQGSQVVEGAPEEVAQQWGEWCTDARSWLGALCNGTPLPGGARERP